MAITYQSAISEVLEKQGRTVSWFCTRMGISRALFYRIEAGERTPTAEFRRAASDLLGVPDRFLFLPVKLLPGNNEQPISNKEVRA